MLETVLLRIKEITLLNQARLNGKRTIIKEMKKERQGKERLKSQINIRKQENRRERQGR